MLLFVIKKKIDWSLWCHKAHYWFLCDVTRPFIDPYNVSEPFIVIFDYVSPLLILISQSHLLLIMVIWSLLILMMSQSPILLLLNIWSLLLILDVGCQKSLYFGYTKSFDGPYDVTEPIVVTFAYTELFLLMSHGPLLILMGVSKPFIFSFNKALYWSLWCCKALC